MTFSCPAPDALLDTLPKELALKEQSGYLEEVLDEYPSWYRHVEELRSEHQTLYSKLRQLRDHIARQVPFADIADEVRGELRDWMNSLIAHHRHETRLLQTAINLEVGVGD